MSKKGLIMEGGAMRGLFTAGVTDVMLEHKIKFDGAVGVSAGAAFGCNYKSEQIGIALRYNKKYCNDKRYCSLHSLITTGNLFGVDFCYHELPEKLDIFDKVTYNNNPMEFYVVCTDVMTGKPLYKKCDTTEDSLLEWIRGSASLPLVSTIVEVNGYKLLDGGISDSIPLKFFENSGYTKNVIILTQPSDYQKQKNKLLPLIKIVMRKYPNLIDTMARRHEEYNKTLNYINEKEKAGDVFVIRPPEKLAVGRIEKNPDKLQLVYDDGRKCAENCISDLKAFLNIK